MPSTPRRAAPLLGRDDELTVLSVRVPRSDDRPLPTEEESDAFEGVDPALHDAVRSHLDPVFGAANSTFHDTLGPVPVDVGLSEPDGDRRWGGCFTTGASARALPAPRDGPRHFELFVRVPEQCFRYWDGVVLEPFDSPLDQVVDLLGDLAKLPHDLGVGYDPPQIVVQPDFAPLVADLPFAGVLLRDAARAEDVRVPAMRREQGGEVRFLSVTFLHASEVRGLIGRDRAQTAARLAAAGVDDLLDLGRHPVA